MKTKSAEIDPRTVLLAQLGDRDALSSLIDFIQSPLLVYIERFTRDQGRSEDVLQDVLLQIFRKLGALNDPSLFKAWAYQIAMIL